MNIAITLDGWVFPWNGVLYEKSAWNADMKRYYMYVRVIQGFDYSYANGPIMLDRQGAEIL